MTKRFGFRVVPVHSGHAGFHKHHNESWVYGYEPETKSFRHFPYNEIPTRALNTTDAIDRREKNSRTHMKVQGRLMQARFIEMHQVFVKENKVGYFSNRVVFIDVASVFIWG